MLSTSRAALLYLGAALIFTWPLARGLARDIPWDLGDSLLNAWILAWDADHLTRLFSGDVGALRGFWNANIFYPEPLTLAYSEHLFAQALQIWPVYAVTGNIILCYNLLFLSTFVLSGLGVFLFVREVTGSARAGFVAGLIYAFAPYRVPQFSHLQVLSSQWMPFVLYGLRKYLDKVSVHRQPSRRHFLPLAGAAAALVAQNLSNGYFLLFFWPFVIVYVLVEIAGRRLWANWPMWIALAIAGVVSALLTLPFLLPYLQLRSLGIPPRPLSEVAAYSADVYGYLTAPPESHLWGGIMRAFPKPEGDLFPSISALMLAAAGAGVAVGAAWRASRSAPFASPRVAAIGYGLFAVSGVYLVLLILVFAGFRITSLGPLPISVRGIGRPVIVLAISTALLVAISTRARVLTRSLAATPIGFFAAACAAAFLLSLGPEIRSAGRLIGESGPYAWFYRYIPGFDGLRVPARYAMLVVLFLSIAAGFGAAFVERRVRRGPALVLSLGIAAVMEGFAAPIVLNGTAGEGGYAAPPPRVYTGSAVPRAYQFLKTLAPETVVAEFPFGEWTYELRYVYYSAHHWQRLLNGYSGHFPLSYSARANYLRHPLDVPELAWEALYGAGATHAVVHESLYTNDEGRRIGDWLVGRGARLVAEFDGDRVFALR